MMATPQERVAAAESLLSDHGLPDARVTAAGHEEEIAAIRTDPRNFARLQELSAGLKSLGFRYVAIDIGGTE